MRIDDSENRRPAGTALTVRQDTTLEALLAQTMQGRSRSSLKKLLAGDGVQVDDRPVHRLDEPLKAGQRVFIGKSNAWHMPEGLHIVWEDAWLLIVKKETGLLTVGNHSEQDKTAEEYLNAYMQFRKQGDRIYVVHRIDRDTSGILVFAKTLKASEILRTQWHSIVESRRYVAVVEGYLRYEAGTVDTWMDEDARRSMMFVSRPGQGKRAITHYRVLDECREGYSLVELELETGRRNQIRVHMAHLGHPLAGDGKYGAQSDPCGRLCLHARQIKFRHPITGETLEFRSEIPTAFLHLFHR